MFGNNKSKEQSPISNSAPSGGFSLNSLVIGTEIEGKVKCTSDIRIDGGIKGDLECKAKVIIGQEGKVEGTINCKNAVIEGGFKGTLNVSELLIVKKDAKVSGDVKVGRLNVESGASFNVECIMTGGNPVKANTNKQHQHHKK